jgi:aminoglycoside 6'-N-acetyltransferase
MTDGSDDSAADFRPTLRGSRVTIRPGGKNDVEALRAVLAGESVRRWWGEPEPSEEIAARLGGDDSGVLLVLECDGQLAGGIQYDEEHEPMYRHASIDIFVGDQYQDRGVGTEAVGLLARFLFEQRGHHRITIDPAVANRRAIRCYEKVGFLPVGVMRQYERGGDGQFHDGLLMDLLRSDLLRDSRRCRELRSRSRGSPKPSWRLRVCSTPDQVAALRNISG